MKDDEQIVQFPVQISADGHLLRDGRGCLIEIGQALQPRLGLYQDACHVLGVQSVVLLLPEEVDQSVQVLLRHREVDVRSTVRRSLWSRDSLLLCQVVRFIRELGIDCLCGG